MHKACFLYIFYFGILIICLDTFFNVYKYFNINETVDAGIYKSKPSQ